jgi:ribonuclease HI
MAKKIYAIRKGSKTGIFSTWTDCKKQVDGFSGAEYKSFTNLTDAESYLKGCIQINTSINKESTPTSDDNTLCVYVDGSYNSYKKIAGYGLVMVKNNNIFLKDFSAYPYKDVTQSHNVGAELIGAKRAVELAIANNYKRVCINYDYLGIEKFATKQWKAKTSQTIEYQNFMIKYMKILDISFNKIKAHSGDTYNDMADKLAKFATNL